ncbi:hypothetical protein A200_03020 [Parascardovia denticolens IPLA 20019]|nr:hypothetical protein A200_03020 [Parascardovia denticolens IPLA 20019]
MAFQDFQSKLHWYETKYSPESIHERETLDNRRFHSHSIPLDMDDVLEDLDEPLAQANLAAKASVIVRAGALDLSSGTGSFRVREMMDRIATSLGIYVRSDVNLTDIEASCSDGANRVTEVVDLPTVGVNTERIWLMEHFTDWLCVNLGRGGSYHRDTHPSSQVIGSLPNEKKSAVAPFPDVIGDADGQTLPSPPEAAGQTDAIGQAGSAGQTGAGSASGVTVRQAHERLDAIEYRHKLYKIGMQVLAAAVSCASFTFLLGGGLIDMVAAFVGAGCGQFIRSKFLGKHTNQFFVTAVAVVVAAFLSIGTLWAIGFAYPPARLHDTAYIGAILFVVPGFPLITGGLDIAKLDISSGIQRIVYFLAIIMAATLAAWAVADIVHLKPAGSFDTSVMLLWVRTALANPWIEFFLRLLTAFGGVWGFSVLFNSPQRMACVAALIGAVADTFRLEIIDFWNVPIEAAAFFGALLAGLLASLWRIAVRHGKIKALHGFPRICLTVPSIVIMVPGLYMYQAVYYLGQFNSVDALNWIFRSLLVVVCLPIGLAVARILTDRNWRYDV